VKAVLLAGGISLLVSLLGTPLFIKFLVRRGYGQFIRDDGPTSHHTKRGTPTMGGALIIAASLLAYGCAHLFTLTPLTVSGILVLFLMTGLGIVGFLDDGLATGASVMVFGSYVIIAIWQFNQNCQSNPGVNCYEVRDPHDLAVVAAALMGSCFGFLWWNASPAKIFMGDTGSLALGGAMAGLAITTRTELLVIILGGLFVIITLSVIIQVGSFKLTGKRVFRMAPLQHHFELAGWDEITIVIRFWIIAGLFVAVGVGVFYGEWVVGSG
jgi:phospho-N-acetylmuramoyl-pentapeptide-transferase